MKKIQEFKDKFNNQPIMNPRTKIPTKLQQKEPILTTRRSPTLWFHTISGLSKSIKNIGSKYGVEVYFQGGSTIKTSWCLPKTKIQSKKQSGVIYRYLCDRVDCGEEYIGESSRTFGERFKEHLKQPSPIYDHSNITGHNVTINNFNIVGREDLNLMRTIKRLCT